MRVGGEPRLAAARVRLSGMSNPKPNRTQHTQNQREHLFGHTYIAKPTLKKLKYYESVCLSNQVLTTNDEVSTIQDEHL